MLHVLTKNTKMSPTIHWQVNKTPDSTHWKGVVTHWKGLCSLKGTNVAYKSVWNKIGHSPEFSCSYDNLVPGH